MSRPWIHVAVVALLQLASAPSDSFAAGPATAESGALLGFGSASAASQRALEARFDAELRVDNLGEWMELLSARPHHVGSPYGHQNARFLAELFRSWGYDTEIEEYQVLFPTPLVRELEMVAPTRYTATLAEPRLAEDATSDQTSEQLPSYNAYSTDGDVTAELVYVNYGVPDDYDELARRGIDVAGKIVLARYGGSWRGIKPKVAAEHGALACILFSDPRDDGYFVGDTYPAGGYRPRQGVQRGSVADMPLFPGDPLTPFVGATESADRLPLEEAPTLTKIPVLPISYGDASPLLEALGGPMAPASWRGSLPSTYRLGPGPATVHLRLEFDWQQVTAYNVIARLEGAELPDQWIIRGNHHDAWVNGATDPVSGLVAVMEEARVVGRLARDGYRPRRTIVYAAWDAEEPGLLGSTEWVEEHAEVLREKAVVYINSDSNSQGFLNAGGSHTLQRLVNEAATDVVDPRTGVPVAARNRARRVLGSAEGRKEALAGDSIRLYPLGSGSDYTPFLQHLGIASLNLGFSGEGHYGQYHSIYDSFDHYTRFMDPGFEYGIALAKVAGRIVLRLANADVLPFDFEALVDNLAKYVDEVGELADTMRDEAETRDELLAGGVFAAAANPGETWLPPERLEPVPHLNFAPLLNAMDSVATSAEALAGALQSERDGAAGAAAGATAGARLDELLFRTERALTRPEGLPVRPWYVHYIDAPGFYTGYGVKTLPAVREAIEQREWTLA
ncbi:MAG: M28 family metallopeptidase, partial [Acidobacteria bacterium]|nr:M28 family metallopeptidase [Acidobacteriota bacterium]